MSRTWMCLLATAIACGNKGDNTGAKPDDKPVTIAKRDLVQVDDDKLVTPTTVFKHPHAFVWVNAHDLEAVLLTDPTWDGGIPLGARKRVDKPDDVMKVLDPVAADLGNQLGSGAAPPPPPPEDMPDDGSDESGGTGTAMALDESKMGKTDSGRVPGQYKMRKDTSDPQLARQQAIEQARSAGILGSSALRGRGELASLGDDALATAPIEDLRDPAVVVAPAPAAPAVAIAKVLVKTHGGAILVAHHDRLALLAAAYAPVHDRPTVVAPGGWTEVHVAADGVHVVDSQKATQTVIAWKGAALDVPGLTAALAGKGPGVDVLVGNGPTVQQLVDTLVALGGKHARLGVLDGTTEARLDKLEKASMLSPGQLNASGDLDKAVIRRYIRRNLNKIQSCYEKTLLAKPGLKGTLMMQFFIAPTGKVETAKGTGVDDAVASCVADVIKTIEFPKPQGGGGVQVNYPFTFRSAAP